jgi:hypothetical protein
VREDGIVSLVSGALIVIFTSRVSAGVGIAYGSSKLMIITNENV